MASPIQVDAATAADASVAVLPHEDAIIQESGGPDMVIELDHNRQNYIQPSSLASFLASVGFQPIRMLNDEGEVEVVYGLQHGNSSFLHNEQAQSAMTIRMALVPHEHVLAEPIVDRGPPSQATFMASVLPQLEHGLLQPAPAPGPASQPPPMNGSSPSELPQHDNGHVEQAVTDQAAQAEFETMRRSAEKAEKRRKRKENLEQAGKGAVGIVFIVLHALDCAGVF